jgi:predicted GH43/DUF377 family glycosyl hydrolase
MKFILTNYILILLIVLTSTSIAQINWKKHPNPVLTPGRLGSWEDYEVYAPFVLKDEDTLKMWYSGSKSFDVDHIGYAISTDGIQWQKHLSNPVLKVGLAGSWDAEEVIHPEISFDDTTYHMWYLGTDNPSWYGYRVGYATSPDGINWTKADSVNPVLDLGDPGEWDSATLGGHSVFFDGDTFHMWYAGCDGPDWANGCIGYATSPDGINWTKDTLNSPVFCGTSNWESVGVYTPSTIVTDSGYEMLYLGYNGLNDYIGYAISTDGINWVPSDSYVLDAGISGNWDDAYVAHPHILLDDTTYNMWYSGGRANTGGRVGYATAPVETGSNSVDNLSKNFPNKYVLHQNYPNPFNPSTTIKFDLPKTSDVTIEVYNIAGQKVQTLLNKKMSAGSHQVEFNAQNFSSGIYYYRINAGEYQDVKKMVLVH